MTEHAIAVIQLLALVPSTLLLCLFFEERSNANTPSFGPEMTAQGIGARESPSTTPVVIVFENTTADGFLLARVKAFVPLAIVLTGKRLTAHRTYERSLVSMRTQMAPEVVSSGESLRTQ